MDLTSDTKSWLPQGQRQLCNSVSQQHQEHVDGPLSEGKKYVHYIQVEPRKTPSNFHHKYWIHPSVAWSSHKWVTNNSFGPIQTETSTPLLSHIITDFLPWTLKCNFVSPPAKVPTREKCVDVARGDEELDEAEIKSYVVLKELTWNESMTNLLA